MDIEISVFFHQKIRCGLQFHALLVNTGTLINHMEVIVLIGKAIAGDNHIFQHDKIVGIGHLLSTLPKHLAILQIDCQQIAGVGAVLRIGVVTDGKIKGVPLALCPEHTLANKVILCICLRLIAVCIQKVTKMQGDFQFPAIQPVHVQIQRA